MVVTAGGINRSRPEDAFTVDKDPSVKEDEDPSILRGGGGGNGGDREGDPTDCRCGGKRWW